MFPQTASGISLVYEILIGHHYQLMRIVLVCNISLKITFEQSVKEMNVMEKVGILGATTTTDHLL